MAFAAAIFMAVSNTLSKKYLQHIDEYALTWVKYLFALPLLLVACLFSTIPTVGIRFWVFLVVLIPIEILLATSFMKAYKVSPISKVIPFGSFSPLFISITGMFLLDEHLSILHAGALLLLVIGAYIASLENNQSLISPLKVISRERGVVYMLFGSILMGITVPLGKIAILNSSTEYFSATYFLFFTLAYLPILVMRSKTNVNVVKRHIVPLVLIGTCTGLFFLCGWNAAKNGPVSLVNAVVSMNSIFTVILAGTYLREQHIAKRLLGSLFMLLGALVVILKPV